MKYERAPVGAGGTPRLGPRLNSADIRFLQVGYLSKEPRCNESQAAVLSIKTIVVGVERVVVQVEKSAGKKRKRLQPIKLKQCPATFHGTRKTPSRATMNTMNAHVTRDFMTSDMNYEAKIIPRYSVKGGPSIIGHCQQKLHQPFVFLIEC